MAKKTKTEHTGAKNGGGYWGTREEAKTTSKSLRRSNDKEEVKEQLDDFGNDVEVKKSQILIQKGIEAVKLGRFSVIEIEGSNWTDEVEEDKYSSDS